MLTGQKDDVEDDIDDGDDDYDDDDDDEDDDDDDDDDRSAAGVRNRPGWAGPHLLGFDAFTGRAGPGRARPGESDNAVQERGRGQQQHQQQQ